MAPTTHPLPVIDLQQVAYNALMDEAEAGIQAAMVRALIGGATHLEVLALAMNVLGDFTIDAMPRVENQSN